MIELDAAQQYVLHIFNLDLSCPDLMALYIKRPRLNEEQIGRGIPSDYEMYIKSFERNGLFLNKFTSAFIKSISMVFFLRRNNDDYSIWCTRTVNNQIEYIINDHQSQKKTNISHLLIVCV